jgi:hypothetical protein
MNRLDESQLGRILVHIVAMALGETLFHLVWYGLFPL